MSESLDSALMQALLGRSDPIDPDSSNVAVIGCGYVGLTTAVCLASLGHHVGCIDTDAGLINQLARGMCAAEEPHLRDLLQKSLQHNAIRFSTDSTVLAAADIIMICVATPPRRESDRPDVGSVYAALRAVRRHARRGSTVVIKSTVPIRTAERAQQMLRDRSISVVANPEFLREGHAILDFLQPARIVVGSDDPEATKAVRALYTGLPCEIVETSPATAELVKYAANGYLAVRLSFVNALAEVSARCGADIDALLTALGADPRIGHGYLRPGPGWAGPCLPKDAQALRAQGFQVGVSLDVLDAAIKANVHHQQLCVDVLAAALPGGLQGRRVALLGLAFKAGTSDTRGSAAHTVARSLSDAGAIVTGHDPMAEAAPIGGITICATAYAAVEAADAVIVLNDANDYAALDWSRVAATMAGQIVVDARHCLDRDSVASAGLRWFSAFSAASAVRSA
ncbi:UDP-glucose dehydrogenase family protein [Nocardia sp. NPDC059239]|uniref:UDP-glucose dehydrogenase family protein n=1 Tax=Nocardia sp. NPDC059239 TaxID=3346785 RepID=UPI0036AEDD2D